MRYAVIRNGDTKKNVAVLIHAPKLGRVVLKCLDSAWTLQKIFDHWVDETLIYHDSIEVEGKPVSVRKKAVKSDPKYLGLLLDRIVRRPYEVADVVDSKSTVRLDNFADNIAKEVLSK